MRKYYSILIIIVASLLVGGGVNQLTLSELMRKY